MLSLEMVKKLNDQINREHYAHNLYLAMGSWCRSTGLDGAADFLLEHAKEEMEHMMRLFTYVSEAGSQATVGALKEPPNQFESLKDVIEQTYEHELLVTKFINELVGFAIEEKDYSTHNFLQWFIAEQHEEEALFKGILDKIELIGTEGTGLYMIDREIKELARMEQMPTE